MTFPRTRWTLVRRALRDPKAMEELLALYHPPVLAFIRSRVRTEQDAEDLAQEVMAAFLRGYRARGSFLDQVTDQAPFRAQLLTLARNTVIDWSRRRAAVKRGGRTKNVSLEEAQERHPGNEPSDRDRADFNRLWAEHLIRIALPRFRKHREARGMGRDAEIISSYLRDRGREEDLAREHSCTPGDIKRAKMRFRSFVGSLMMDYLESPQDLAAEVAALGEYL